MWEYSGFGVEPPNCGCLGADRPAESLFRLGVWILLILHEQIEKVGCYTRFS